MNGLTERERFVTDLRSYLRRQRLSVELVAHELAIPAGSLEKVLSDPRVEFPEELAVRLADLADLSLDNYRAWWPSEKGE